MLGSLLWIVVAASLGQPRAVPRAPVLVELFTSEGCSSCPPADALLASLLAGQPVEGAEIIGLELHVDYWDRQGWKDPFSSAAFTKRQDEYAKALNVADIYTPQVVVDGAAQMVGTDAEAVRRAIHDAAGLPHLPVRITARATAGSVHLAIDLPPAPSAAEPIDVIVALAEGGLVSHVLRGENSGRTLEHAAVVRRLETAGALQHDGMVTEAEWKLNARWTRSRLQAVVWLQGRKSRRIYGSATAGPGPTSSAF